jgi:hypothetical protein
MKKALVHESRICEFGTPFPVHESLTWVDVADDTTQQDTYVDGAVVKYVEPVPTTLEKIMDLESAVTQRRMRDAFSGDADALKFIADVEDEIAIERGKL